MSHLSCYLNSEYRIAENIRGAVANVDSIWLCMEYAARGADLFGLDTLVQHIVLVLWIFALED